MLKIFQKWLVASALLFAVPDLAVAAPSQMVITGVPEVGSVLTPAVPIPAGSTCSWARNGAQVSTSCTSYTVQSADAGATLTFQVEPGRPAYAALAVNGTPPSTGSVGTTYSFTPTASNGSGAYVFSQTGGLPPGLGFNTSTGAVSGTPTVAGTYAGLAITVTDSVGGSAALAANPFTITISSAAALTLSGTPPSTGTVGTAYSFTPTASNGSGGYVFSQTGALPPGLGFNTGTGALAGTPTVAGTYAGLAITVTDSSGATAGLAANPFTITIGSGGGGGSPSLDFSQASNSQYLAVVF